jgi:hypothetical protein
MAILLLDGLCCSLYFFLRGEERVVKYAGGRMTVLKEVLFWRFEGGFGREGVHWREGVS